jgi:hypothetical protein
MRLSASQSDPSGVDRMEAFGNSLADSVSFRFPFRSTLGGAPLFQQWSRIVHASPAGWSGELGENGIIATVET